MVALAFVLSMLKVIDMPFGGSVTAFSMLPIAVIAYRYGTAWGLLTGVTYSSLQLVMGLKNLTYATSAAAGAAIVSLDYIAAFTVLGFAGIFRRRLKDDGISLAAGALLGCVLRYACHVITGCTVWAGVSIPSADGLVFSLAYNAAYMVPETMLTVVGAYFAGKAFTLTKEQVTRVRMERKAMANLYAAIPAAIGVVISFTFVFSMMQTSDGFDITAVSSADIFKWIPAILTFTLGILGALIIRITLSRKPELTVKD